MYRFIAGLIFGCVELLRKWSDTLIFLEIYQIYCNVSCGRLRILFHRQADAKRTWLEVFDGNSNVPGAWADGTGYLSEGNEHPIWDKMLNSGHTFWQPFTQLWKNTPFFMGKSANQMGNFFRNGFHQWGTQ